MQLAGTGGGQSLPEDGHSAYHDTVGLLQGLRHVQVQHLVYKDARKGHASHCGKSDHLCV